MGVADEVIAADRAARRNVWLETGTVISIDVTTPGTVVLNLGGAEVIVPTLQPVLPNDLVRVARSLDGTPIVLGPAGSFPAQGTVSAVASGASVSVLGDDGLTYTNRPYLLSYAPVVGHLVAMDVNGRVLGRLSTAAGAPDPSVQPPPTPTPPPSAGSGTTYFGATNSGSYQGGRYWTDKVYYAENNLGAWFYGTQVRDTLAGATAVAGCAIYLPVELAQGSNMQLGLHSQAVPLPSGPDVSAGRPVSVNVDHADWYPLDLDLAQWMIDHAGAGISTYGPGYRIISGLGSNRDSGRLAIAWRRG